MQPEEGDGGRDQGGRVGIGLGTTRVPWCVLQLPGRPGLTPKMPREEFDMEGELDSYDR